MTYLLFLKIKKILFFRVLKYQTSKCKVQQRILMLMVNYHSMTSLLTTKNTFTTSVFHIPTFTGLLTNLWSFVPFGEIGENVNIEYFKLP